MFILVLLFEGYKGAWFVAQVGLELLPPPLEGWGQDAPRQARLS